MPDMSTDAKPTTPMTPGAPATRHREKGIKIFMWPKVIFLYPTAIVALICAVGMQMIGDRVHDPARPISGAVDPRLVTGDSATLESSAAPMDKLDRFWTPQNLLGILFLAMLAFNLVTMGIDLPRFSLVAVVFGILFAAFFLLWLGSYFQLDLIKPIHAVIAHIYAVANRGFYVMFFVTLMFVFLIIWATRWLDYWEIMPNEILHHHGPLSDLERYPTMNLKFDKEIPDVLEWILLGAGRLVLHIPNVPKAIVLDNVLFISRKEDALKHVMSRLEVRVTTDQEAGEGVI
jgi:hypothetical protein